MNELLANEVVSLTVDGIDTNNDEELARQMAEDIEMMNEQDME